MVNLMVNGESHFGQLQKVAWCFLATLKRRREADEVSVTNKNCPRYIRLDCVNSLSKIVSEVLKKGIIFPEKSFLTCKKLRFTRSQLPSPQAFCLWRSVAGLCGSAHAGIGSTQHEICSEMSRRNPCGSWSRACR